MSDVGTVIVAIFASVLSVAIIALVIVAIIRRRSRGGGVTLSIAWHNERDGIEPRRPQRTTRSDRPTQPDEPDPRDES